MSAEAPTAAPSEVRITAYRYDSAMTSPLPRLTTAACEPSGESETALTRGSELGTVSHLVSANEAPSRRRSPDAPVAVISVPPIAAVAYGWAKPPASGPSSAGVDAS